MLNFNREIYKSGIARRLIIYVVLFSSFITLLTTAIQLYRDYNNDLNLIEDHLQQVQDVHLKALTATLWASDAKELRTHLEGISQLRDMRFLEVRDQENVWVSLGDPQSRNVISRQYPMIYTHRGRDIEIGTLTVVASLEGIYQRLIDKIWVILVSNGIKTFLVAGFILIIFHALITRHLIRIADFARTLDINRLDRQLELDRKGYHKQKMDELDMVVNAINQMQVNIEESFTALEQSEERFQILAKVSPVGIFRTDAQGNCIYTNERWRELAGMREAQALGEGWARALHPEDRERVFTEWYQAAADNIPFKTECRFQRPDGKVTWLLSLAEAELNAEGQVVGYVGAITDITERKRAEEELRAHREHLEELVEERTSELRAAQEELLRKERLATLGQLTATVSHELRNPLGTLRTSLFSITRKLRGDRPELEPALERMDRNITRCDNIIHEMLDFSRIRNLDLRPVAVNELVTEILAEQAAPEEITVKRCFGAATTAQADRERLRRAILNILANAYQAFAEMPEADHREPTVIVGTRVHDHRLEITVDDNGPGIPETTLAHIFEPLYSTKGFGIGLGLPIVKQIMEQHGGGVEVSSEKGRGSHVVLWLPVSEEEGLRTNKNRHD